MAAVDELGTYLQALQGMKAPGIGKKAIEAINTLCIVNVGSDAALVEKIAAHFKTTPSTHKLGVLYVIDSVTRQWIEKAKQTGQALIGSAAAPGTYASGVHRMTEVLPGLMSDIIVTAPETQKEKIAKLIDIWGTANTFPADMLSDFKRKLQGPTQTMRTFPSSATSNGTTNNASAINGAANNISNGANVAAASANGLMPSNNTSTQGLPAQAQLPPAAAQIPPDQLAAALGFLASQAQAQPVQSAPNAAGNAPNLSSQMQALCLPQFAAAPQNLAPPQPAQPAPPSSYPAASAASADLSQQLQVITQLVQSGLSPDQISQVMAAMGLPMPPIPPPAAVAPPPSAPVPAQQVAPAYQPPSDVAYLSAAGVGNQYEQTRRRTRSRSPDRDFKRRRVTPPNRRESPVYGVYDPEASQHESGRHADADRRGRNNHGKGWNRNRRSPPGRPADRVASPMLQGTSAPLTGPPPKWIDFDPSLPQGHIRVLSRTLFVGGVAATESEIRDIFSRFGRVQTCIVNIDKRHAFVKMVNRPDAMSAKSGMDLMKDSDVQSKIRSTKWGVGFGPRECSDYSTGVSVVPISALTEADKRWLLTAEYGGTGGRALESGMVVEEPDIEIGAGVSSKAISRRIESSSMKKQNHGHRNDHGKAQQQQQQQPPQQTKFAQESYGYDRPPPSSRPPHQHQHHQQPRYRETAPEPARAKAAAPSMLKPEPNTVGVPPAVPTFGFQLPGFNIR